MPWENSFSVFYFLLAIIPQFFFMVEFVSQSGLLSLADACCEGCCTLRLVAHKCWQDRKIISGVAIGDSGPLKALSNWPTWNNLE